MRQTPGEWLAPLASTLRLITAGGGASGAETRVYSTYGIVPAEALWPALYDLVSASDASDGLMNAQGHNVIVRAIAVLVTTGPAFLSRSGKQTTPPSSPALG